MESNRTVLLTSRENFVWHSMQEIIPFIENAWSKLLSAKHSVRVLNVDTSHFKEIAPEILQADNIVLTCFTARICGIASVARKWINPEARFIIYLHNQATIACWPFQTWGLGELFRTDDLFLSSCRPDQEALNNTFEKADVRVVPFSFSDSLEVLEHGSSSPDMKSIPFVYVGRISPQKNLHVLLYSFYLFRNSHPEIKFTLNIYGSEDDLGSPNMGIEFGRYQEFLEKLATKLKITRFVKFHGHRSRQELYSELKGTKHIFVSASLHSDENFGMAAFRSLCLGHSAVLSRWGGHIDFAHEFDKRVQLVPVVGTKAGPAVNPKSLAESLYKATQHYSVRTPPSIPNYYLESSITRQLFEIACEKTRPGQQLIFTELAKKIALNRDKYLGDSHRKCKIFESYSDVDAIPFFRSYGMEFESGKDLDRIPEPLFIPPWVKTLENKVAIKDPHRGARWITSSDYPKMSVIEHNGRIHEISQSAARNLLELGYAHH